MTLEEDLEEDLARRLRDAALGLLDSLGDDERAGAHLPFDDAERRSWQYTPGRRAGLWLGQTGRRQAKAAHRLLAAGLRLSSYARAVTIMALEDVLDVIEGGLKGRHAGDYWAAVFGDPDGDGPWGWRFEGHHVSVNYTVAEGRVAATPLFLGANPAGVGDGDAVVVRPLGREEDLAYALMASLDERGRARAVFSDEAPPDVVTGHESQVGAGLEPRGVAGTDLAGESAQLLEALARTFVERLPPELAGRRLTELGQGGLGEMHFAWAGPLEPGHRHYYRLQGGGFLAELDNTEEGANHVHTVVRDLDDDFGRDLLAAHRSADHGQ